VIHNWQRRILDKHEYLQSVIRYTTYLYLMNFGLFRNMKYLLLYLSHIL
jgi:hypothetical protein